MHLWWTGEQANRYIDIQHLALCCTPARCSHSLYYPEIYWLNLGCPQKDPLEGVFFLAPDGVKVHVADWVVLKILSTCASHQHGRQPRVRGWVTSLSTFRGLGTSDRLEDTVDTAAVSTLMSSDGSCMHVSSSRRDPEVTEVVSSGVCVNSSAATRCTWVAITHLSYNCRGACVPASDRPECGKTTSLECLSKHNTQKTQK